HGATSVIQFRDDGYLPEALLNFLALVGWSYDDKTELFTRQQLIEYFTLDKIGHAPAVFDHAKLDWMTGYYIRALPDDELAARLLPFLERAHLQADAATVRGLVPLVRERLKKLSDIVALADFLFLDDLEHNPGLLIGKADAVSALAALRAAHVTLAKYPSFADEEKIEAELRADAQKLGQKNAQFFGALRVAVTGKTVSLPLMGSLRLLGAEKTLRRIARAIALLEHKA
ncbi:MAG: glutamate--tRNA ligase, partial [Chloroflexota bacterium]|nr:glutamate--tRNA ligase [Chloroflexota bacterium]